MLRASDPLAIFLRFIGASPIFHWYIGDFSHFLAIFLWIDNRWRLSFRWRPISDISSKYRRYFPIFQSLGKTTDTGEPRARVLIWEKKIEKEKERYESGKSKLKSGLVKWRGPLACCMPTAAVAAHIIPRMPHLYVFSSRRQQPPSSRSSERVRSVF